MPHANAGPTADDGRRIQSPTKGLRGQQHTSASAAPFPRKGRPVALPCFGSARFPQEADHPTHDPRHGPSRCPPPRRRAPSRPSWSTSTRTPSSRSTCSCGRLSENRNDIFVVGDPDQAIYGWRGAELFQRYRSGGRLLETATAMIRYNTNRLDHGLQPANPPGPRLATHDAIDEAAFASTAPCGGSSATTARSPCSTAPTHSREPSKPPSSTPASPTGSPGARASTSAPRCASRSRASRGPLTRKGTTRRCAASSTCRHTRPRGRHAGDAVHHARREGPRVRHGDHRRVRRRAPPPPTHGGQGRRLPRRGRRGTPPRLRRDDTCPF